MLKIKLHNAVNFKPAELKRLESALVYLGVIVNSADFKNAVLNHKYLGKKQFADNGGLTNEEIYNFIMSGKEVLTPEVDGEIDLQITIYNAYVFGRSTIGYTYPNTSMQWINRRFFSRFSIEQISSNVFHEYLHNLGFSHDFKATAKRPYSVPYSVGSMMLYQGGKMVNFNEHQE